MRGHRPIAATIEHAPAKINLGLHVIGQRADGFHELDMLVCFTKLGDTIHISPAKEDGFSIQGPYADKLDANADNLVTRARDELRAYLTRHHALTTPVHILLNKRLPVASGIGGGSADAAAALRGLLRHWDVVMADEALAEIGIKLGADVPMCLKSQMAVAQGVGEKLTYVPHPLELFLVLVNPLKGVSTPQVFKALECKNNAPMPAISPDKEFDWAAHLKALRNDLQAPAMQLLPEIGNCLEALQQQGAYLCRMSGSGATCFGLFESLDEANIAAVQIKRQYPHWFVEATQTLEA